jgi:hypothetical protein
LPYYLLASKTCWLLLSNFLVILIKARSVLRTTGFLNYCIDIFLSEDGSENLPTRVPTGDIERLNYL